MDDELLEIGQFSAASGLTVAALRHYDEVGVLKPAEVDPKTSYRRYRRNQLAEAGIICQLRSVDLPIDEVRSVLRADDAGAVRDLLIRHQGRLAERAHTLERMIETSHTYLDRGVPPRPPAARRAQFRSCSPYKIVTVSSTSTGQSSGGSSTTAFRRSRLAPTTRRPSSWSRSRTGTWATLRASGFWSMKLIPCTDVPSRRAPPRSASLPTMRGSREVRSSTI